jgi:uncharacterized membrane protein YdjX (TVP38/TMEM64 family)
MPWKKALLLGLAIVAILLFFLLDLDRFFTLASLKEHRQLLQQKAAAHPLATPLLFMAIYSCKRALLPVRPSFLGSGLLFGAILGSIFAVVAATLAHLAFFVTRFCARCGAAEICPGLKASTANLRRGLQLPAFLRLVPIFPFF